MRGRTSILETQKAEASRISTQIAGSLHTMNIPPLIGRQMHEITHDIRIHKTRLLRIEQMLSEAGCDDADWLRPVDLDKAH